MSYTIILSLLFLGFILIIKGGDYFVDSSIWLAKRTGIPSLIVGATVVSIGTTIPEICVSVMSIIKGIKNPALMASFQPIAITNSIGSILCNTAFILALVIMIKPPKAEGKSFREKAIFLIVVLALLILFVNIGGSLNVIEGVILLVLFVAFIIMNVFDAKKQMVLPENIELNKKELEEAKKENSFFMIIMFILGAAAIGYGAELLSTYGQQLAVKMGIPEGIVGVTVLAVGTSLPELVTSVQALRKGDSDMGLGNVIGANIINATLLLGLVTTISGNLVFTNFTKLVTLSVMFGLMLVLLVPAIIKKKTMKWQGYVMISGYFIFMIVNVVLVIIGVKI